MLSDKDAAGVAAKFGDRIDHWFCADLAGPRALPGKVLAERIAPVLPGAKMAEHESLFSTHADPAQAFAAARERASENDRIVVFGSFLTVASVLQALGRSV